MATDDISSPLHGRTLVLLRGDPHDPLLTSPGAVGKLTRLLAEATAATYQDGVLLLHFDPAGTIVHATTLGTLTVSVLPLAGEGELMHAITEAVATHGDGKAYVFVDLGDSGVAPYPALAGHVDLLVYLDTRKDAPPPPPPGGGGRSMRTVFLPPPPAPKPRPGWIAGIGDEVALELRRIEGKTDEVSQPLSRIVLDHDLLRLQLDCADVLSTSPMTFTALDDRCKRSFERWARAVTHRRVGLALGGSGAWGYGSVAMMKGLVDAGVPIDFIGGSSSGSLMGAYYAVLGPPGLDLIVERAWLIQAIVVPAMITTGIIEIVVNHDCNFAHLEDLEVPLIPVTTNLNTGEAEGARVGLVGFGVRASASAPGLFASTLTNDAILADGALSNNVPVDFVRDAGADLVIATNPIPAPIVVANAFIAKNPFIRALQSISPLGRVIDLVGAVEIWLHTSGDFTSKSAQVVYDPPRAFFPALGAFQFWLAKAFLERMKHQPEFQEALAAAIKAWKQLATPRVGPPLPKVRTVTGASAPN